MPNSTLEETTLINIPSGKKHLGEDKYSTQAAQKGGTCWYYSYNHLRPRIGKKLEQLIRTSLPHEDQTAEASELLAIRETEKIISEYRKNIERRYLTLVELIGALENSDKSSIKITHQYYHQHKIRKIPSELSSVILNLNKLGLYPQNDALEQVINILEQFMSQNVYTDLEQYAEAVQDEDVIQYSNDCCKALGIEQELTQAITERTRSVLLEKLPQLKDKIAAYQQNTIMVQFNKFSNSTKAITIADLIVKEFAKKYNFTHLAWDPDQNDFSELLKHIDNHGGLAIHVRNIGLASYETQPLKEGTLNNYQIYSWPEDAKKRGPSTVGHAILLVGGQRIKNEKGEIQETVLFLDPNDKSKADKERIAYRIPYEELAKNIMRSVPLYSANKEFAQHVEKTHQNWQKKTTAIQRINKELERLQNSQSSTGNFLVSIGILEASDSKITAFEELKTILRKNTSSEKQVHEFHEELHKWKETYETLIAKQRNYIHTFFSPTHKPTAAKTVEDIFTDLNGVDKVNEIPFEKTPHHPIL